MFLFLSGTQMAKQEVPLHSTIWKCCWWTMKPDFFFIIFIIFSGFGKEGQWFAFIYEELERKSYVLVPFFIVYDHELSFQIFVIFLIDFDWFCCINNNLVHWTLLLFKQYLIFNQAPYLLCYASWADFCFPKFQILGFCQIIIFIIIGCPLSWISTST